MYLRSPYSRLQRNVKFRQKSQDILQKSCSYTIEIVSLTFAPDYRINLN